jgi:hypothetical protein
MENEKLTWKVVKHQRRPPTFLLVDDADNVIARFENEHGVFFVEILGKREYSTWPAMSGNNVSMARWIESKIRECAATTSSRAVCGLGRLPPSKRKERHVLRNR